MLATLRTEFLHRQQIASEGVHAAPAAARPSHQEGTFASDWKLIGKPK
jgi:hypothetical protein